MAEDDRDFNFDYFTSDQSCGFVNDYHILWALLPSSKHKYIAYGKSSPAFRRYLLDLLVLRHPDAKWDYDDKGDYGLAENSIGLPEGMRFFDAGMLLMIGILSGPYKVPSGKPWRPFDRNPDQTN